MKKAILKLTVLAFITLLPLNSICFAQSPTGILSGRILDERGAVIAKSRLTLHNQNTNIKQRTEADENGNFSFPSLLPGDYTLLAEYDGFTKTQISNIKISVGQNESFMITLKAGGMNEQVTVRSDDNVQSTFIRIDSYPKTEFPIDHRQVANLPLLTRNAYELVTTIAGAALTSDARGIGLAVNGQRGVSGNYVLDGGENNNLFSGGAAQNIPLGSVQEFRVFTNTYNAEYGRSSGFVANIASSKGDNIFNGSVYLFNRNSVLSANSFTNRANSLPKPVFNRNQFGGSIGGPIKKEKLFFFTNLEPIIVRSTGSTSFFVPTQQFLNISSPDTSELFNRAQSVLKNYVAPPDASTIKSENLFTLALCPFGTGRNPNGKCADAKRVDYFARVFATGPRNEGAGLPQNTFLSSSRGDYEINPNNKVYGRYSLEYADFSPSTNNPYSSDLYAESKTRAQNFLLNVTSVLPINWILESRAIYGRTLIKQPGKGRVGDDNYLPNLFFPFSSSLPGGYSDSGGVQNVYQFYETVSLIAGNHTIKFGGQYVHARDNRELFYNLSRGVGSRSNQPFGNFGNPQNFVDGVLTYYVAQIDPNSGSGTQFCCKPSSARHYHYNESSLFIQDTWKLSDHLSISPGLRWEYFGVFHSVGSEKAFDVNFYYGQGNDIFERIRNGNFYSTPEAPGKYREHFYQPDYNNFAPRLGIAYDVLGKGKVILRSGIGMFYDRNIGQVQHIVNQNAPDYAQIAFFQVDLAKNQSLLSTPYPVKVQADATSTFGQFARGQIDQDLKTAYTISWNFGVETKIKDIALGLTYVGASGNKLYSLNVTNRLGSGAKFLQDADPFSRLFNDNGAGEFITLGNLGHATYHGLQLRADRRVQQLGLQFGVNYTYSHSIDNVSSVLYDDNLSNQYGFGFLDPFNPGLDRGDSDFDTRHRLVTNFVWDLPFGGNSDRWLVKNFVKGWSVSGIFSFQTGQPFTLYDTTSFDFYEALRPRFSGTLPSRQRTPVANRFNTFLYIPVNPVYDGQGNCTNIGPFYCAPSVNGPFDGSLSRNIFRRPSTQYHNLAVMKDMKVPFAGERTRLQIRAEFYNVFNHANLYVNRSSNDVYNQDFVTSLSNNDGITIRRGNDLGVANTAGVQSFIDNRQIVIGVKISF